MKLSFLSYCRMWLVDLALLFVALIWGASYAVAKGTLEVTPILSLIFFRFLISIIILVPFCLRHIKKITQSELLRGMLLGCILTCIFLFETFGVFYTSATNAAFLISLCVLLTPMLDSVLASRFPPLSILSCAFLSLIGTGLMVLNESTISLNIGDVLILCAAFLRAIMVVSTKRLFVSKAISSMTLTFIQFTTVTVLSGIAIVTTQGIRGLIPSGPITFWAGLIFLALLCTLAAFFIQNWAVRKTNPTRVGFLMGTEPVFGALFAIMLLNESLTIFSTLGALLILLSTFAGVRLSYKVVG